MHERSDEEHLAPITYLPWAVPADRADRADRPTRSTRASHAAADSVDRDAQAPVPVPRGRRGRRLEAVPAEGDEIETGVERDARIDRLVVSRLARSSLSRAEVRSVLVEHGLDDAEVEEWLERYERLGYLDDARLAEQLVHAGVRNRGRGSGAILAELGRRGVEPSAARAAIEEIDPDAERANAIRVAAQRARQLRGLERPVAERRLTAFLLRRGYPSEVVREAVTEALADDRP